MNGISAKTRAYLTLFFAFPIAVCVADSPESKTGGDPIIREGWRVGLDLGLGSIDYTAFGSPESDQAFYVALNAGYAVSSQIRLGLETNGWLLNAGNAYSYQPLDGEGISQTILLTSHLYPRKDSDWYLKLGWGQSSYWRDASGFRETGSGAWTLGVGTDIRARARGGWSPYVSFSGGRTDGVDYNAVTFAVSLFGQIR